MNDAPDPSAPVSPPITSRSQELLLDFLREHDSTCPVCGYNLRALTRPMCPECGQELVLAVSTPPLQLKWLLAAVAPGFFSGIAAIFVLLAIVMRLTQGDGRMSWVLNGMDLFGWCSGIVAIVLARKRHRFLAMPRERQRRWALGIWLMHIAALGLFLLTGFLFS